MNAEYTGVKIKLGDEEKVITPQQAEELRDALVQLLGPKKAPQSIMDRYEAMRKVAQSYVPNQWQNPECVPYKIAPQAMPNPMFPNRPNVVYCGTTSAQAIH